MTFKPSSVGVSGTRVVFHIGGRSYITSAVTPAGAATLTVAQAEALIASGQATAQAANYLDQFPWTRPPR